MKNLHIKLALSLLLFSSIKAQEDSPSLESLDSQLRRSACKFNDRPYNCPACILNPAKNIKETVETCCYNSNESCCKPALQKTGEACNLMSMIAYGETYNECSNRCLNKAENCERDVCEIMNYALFHCCQIFVCRPIHIINYTLCCEWLSDDNMNNQDNQE